MKRPDPSVLRQLATKYIWWKSSEEAAAMPERVTAQVMDIGELDDIARLIDASDEDYLRHVLVSAEIGQFRPRSWAYWHYRLGLVEPGDPVPPQPTRKLAS